MLPIEPPAIVEVNAKREYIEANESACRLLGYSREELLTKKIEDISFPSGAHVSPMFDHFRQEGEMKGVFAVKSKSGEVFWIRYTSAIENGRMIAQWTEYEPATL